MVKSGDRIRAAVNVLEAEDGVMNVLKIGGVEYVKKAGSIVPGFEVSIDPMGAVRMTQGGKYVKDNAQRYLQYKTLIALEARKHFKEPMEGPIEVKVVFFVKPPKKMPKGRTEPTVKPDIDNMIKGIFDALNKIAWKDDAQVISVISQKHYYDEPHIRVTVEPYSA